MFSYTLLVVFLFVLREGVATKFTVVNRCSNTVWPGILSSAGSLDLHNTGFALSPGAMRSFDAPQGWSGRIWGRTGCNFDPVTGQGSCVTGNCGSNQLECNGAGAAPPATLAEFTIGAGSQDFYDVSLVDGYNLPMIVDPVGGTGACGSTGCATDLNKMCPAELRAGDGQACRSACEAFGNPEYCCSGAYGSPAACRPSVYSESFKSACPRAYSYAYDDASSTFTCNGADYTITFCPLLTSQKSSRDYSTAAAATTSLVGPGATEDTGAPPQDEFPWLPNFFSSPDSVLSPPPIISIATFLFLSLFITF